MKKTVCLSLLAFSSLFADAEIDALKAQLKEQQINTQKLEEKVDALSQKSTESLNTSASFSQNAYLPDIALVMNMSAVTRNVNNTNYKAYAIPGFINSGDADIQFNKNRGFNFNYAEVALSSTVDPYFDAFAIFHISPAGFEIEEAYVRTRALPYAMRVKAGKFKSDFGRINNKHQHAWNFDSQPIIYEALFGPDAINDPGVQLQWVAPTDTYVMAGLEALQGTNDKSFGNSEQNNLYIAYLKSSVDIGDDFSVLGGFSAAHGENTQNNTVNPTDIYGIDLTLREQLGSYSSLVLQSELLCRHKNLGTTTNKQAGLYSELIYQANNNWSGGVRYDLITKNETDLTTYSGVDVNNLERYTAMVEYKPFPMSRLRLQYTYDRSKIISSERKDINEVVLSLNIAAGAHGAHDY